VSTAIVVFYQAAILFWILISFLLL